MNIEEFEAFLKLTDRPMDEIEGLIESFEQQYTNWQAKYSELMAQGQALEEQYALWRRVKLAKRLIEDRRNTA
jgi:hypothetical protein